LVIGNVEVIITVERIIKSIMMAKFATIVKSRVIKSKLDY